MVKLTALVLISGLLLVACSSSPPTGRPMPTPDIPATVTAQVRNELANLMAQAPTHAPVPTPEPTATLAPITAPVPTQTPRPTPTLTPTATPEPVPTPAVAAAGGWVMVDGNWRMVALNGQVSTPTPSPTPWWSANSTATPTPRPTRLPLPTLEMLPLDAPVDKSWPRVDSNIMARKIQASYPDVAEVIARLSWVRDGIDEEEVLAYRDLLRVVKNISESTGSQVLARRIVQMPFIKEMGPGDTQALRSLSTATWMGTIELLMIIDHPAIKETGITDSHLPRLAAMNSAILGNKNLVNLLLSPERTYVDSTTITTRLSNQTHLHVLREPEYLYPHFVKELGPLVESVESMMDVPLPTDFVVVMVVDIDDGPNYQGWNAGSHIVLSPEVLGFGEWYDLNASLVHEVAHYYWSHDPNWMDEGMANVLEAMYAGGNQARYPVRFTYPCADYQNIKELDESNPPPNHYSFYCNYALGERLFHSLRLAMGDRRFLQAAKEFYLLIRDGDVANPIRQIKEAFGNDGIIDIWYSGSDQRSPKQPDTSYPSRNITELGTTINSFTIHVPETSEKITQFSASRYASDRIWVSIGHRGRQIVQEAGSVTYTLEGRHEDGFAFVNREISLTTFAGDTGAINRASIGTNGRPWKPGVHTATLYNQQGIKVAETSWTVRP